MGIIDCLSAGYRFLGRRFELLLIPLALDLLLWFGPQLKVATIFADLATLYQQMAAADGISSEMAQLVDQLSSTLVEIGNASNLVTGVVSSGLLHLPSLPVVAGPVLANTTVEVLNPWLAVFLWLGFNVLGLLIGVFYLGLLARQLPMGEIAKASTGAFIGAALRQWGRVLALVILLVSAFLLAMIPLSLIFGLLILASPGLISLVSLLVGFLSLIVFVYFYFVIPGLIMDDLPLSTAISRSMKLVQTNFGATLGFILLSNIIGLGFALLLTQIAAASPWMALIAIVVNAYIGTGLSMALLVFYRSRVLNQVPA